MALIEPDRNQIRKTQLWKGLLAALLLIATGPATSQEKTTSDEALQMWVYSMYPPAVMRNKLNPYMKFLEQKMGRSVVFQGSSTPLHISSSCKDGLPHIIIGSMTVSRKVITECAYHTVAVTYQPLKLYVRNNSIFESLDELQNVGGIINSDVSAVLYDELNQANSNLNMINYPNLLALMKGQDVDQLDGIILAQAMMIAAPLLDQDYHSIHSFNARGRGVVLLSPRLDEKTNKQLTSILLSNGKIAEKVWQQGIGAGAFVAPRNDP